MKKTKLFFGLLLCALLVCALFACKEDPTKSETPEEDHEHTFTAFTVTTEPSENAQGEVKLLCTCGAEEKMVLPALSETAYSVRIVEPTCLQDGQKIYECKYGAFSVPIAATGHSFVETSHTAATCTKEGTRVYECSACHERKEETEDRIEHDYRVIAHVDGSCATAGETGETTYECSVCRQVVRVPYKKPHTFDEGVHTAVPCPAKGYTTYTCEECHETKVVYDASPAHVFDDKGVCTVCGETCGHDFHDYVCTLCGADINARVQEDGYFHVDANGNGAIDVGEKIYYGFYPTSVVGKDTETLALLEQASPDENGVYTVAGRRYVKTTVDQERGYNATFSDGRTVSAYAEAYFLFDPVLWTVVNASDGVVLYADSILDVAIFTAGDNYAYVTERGEYYYVTGDNAGEAFANAWEESDLRAYLNGAFYDRLTSGLNTDPATASAIDNDTSNYYKTKVYAHGEETTDVVYLPAYADLYGEEDAFDEASGDRQKLSTDYAKARGLSLYNLRLNGGASPYYLRSVGYTSRHASAIDGTGAFVKDAPLFFDTKNGKTSDGIGFAPMVRLGIT